MMDADLDRAGIVSRAAAQLAGRPLPSRERLQEYVMQAITFDRYGPPDVLELSEIDKPTPEGDRVLVRVRAASVNPIDWHFMIGLPMMKRMQFGLIAPRVNRLGIDLAGRVEAAGSGTTQLHPGEDVFGAVDEDSGGSIPELGSLAEHVCVSEGVLAPKPSNLNFEQAAAVPTAGMTARYRSAGACSSQRASMWPPSGAPIANGLARCPNWASS
jgi:NADPH:quinone reductase-like Zn-dependent oxidoreductase